MVSVSVCLYSLLVKCIEKAQKNNTKLVLVVISGEESRNRGKIKGNIHVLLYNLQCGLNYIS